MNLLQAELLKAEIKRQNKPAMVDVVKVAGKTFAIRGKVLKTASLNREWQYDVDNPEEVIRVLKDSDMQIDLLKFWQRVPETEPKYQYYREWRQVAAIPITDFKHWWDKQVNCKTRNMVRKSQKLGVIIKQIELEDEFVRGVVDIYNQSPIRRGKRFRHYGKGVAAVKRELSDAGGEAVYVAAYDNKELIGFIQFLIADRYAMITMILDKQAHRDKAPMNGMIAKVVEICADRQIRYLTYTVWRRGEHGQFQKHNGFTKIPVPEYYVPITLRGRLALFLKLHEGLQSFLPETVIVWLLRMRAKWYSFRYPSRESGCNVATV